MADAEVEDLDGAVAFACRDLTCALRELVSVGRSRDEDAHGTVEDLVHAVEDEIALLGRHDRGRDLVPPPEHCADVDGLGHGNLLVAGAGAAVGVALCC
ncbi:hypothetical protein CGQ25_17000 [Sinomonas sp. R1AF57]|nr:hypothetical protein CGQ25_17000 [Sinomonas sp. R1AF57]